jgi:hypothetical protein
MFTHTTPDITMRLSRFENAKGKSFISGGRKFHNFKVDGRK